MSEEMIVYRGWLRQTEVAVQVTRLDEVAGEIVCRECGGDGDWTKFHPEPECGPFPCTECKGTGKVLVSI